MDLDRLPDLLRAARRRTGLTQAELATAAGVNPSTVSDIENGKRLPELETLGNLLTVMGTNLARLYHWTPPTTGSAIRAGRDAIDLPLSDLAHRTGLDVEYLDRIERGKATPSESEADRIAHCMALGSLDDMMELAAFHDPNAAPPAIEQQLAPIGARVARIEARMKGDRATVELADAIERIKRLEEQMRALESRGQADTEKARDNVADRLEAIERRLSQDRATATEGK